MELTSNAIIATGERGQNLSAWLHRLLILLHAPRVYYNIEIYRISEGRTQRFRGWMTLPWRSSPVPERAKGLPICFRAPSYLKTYRRRRRRYQGERGEREGRESGILDDELDVKALWLKNESFGSCGVSRCEGRQCPRCAVRVTTRLFE